MSGAAASEDFLDNIPGINDEAEESSQDGSTDVGSSEGGQQSSGGFGSGGREDAQGQQANDDPSRIVRRQDGLVERQSTDDPRRRDLVDPVNGQVVARGGIERRVYEQGKRAEREAQVLRNEVNQLRAQTQAHQQANNIGTQLGLSPDVQVTAMRVMSDFMRDPVKTIEYLIAEVKSKGYNIPSLNGQGQATDLDAFGRIIDQRLRPITQQYERQQQVEQANQRAKVELDNFLNDVPDARANLDIIAEMIVGDRSLNMQSAYTRFLLWCSANQLDPTQHVGPQLQARQHAAQQSSPAQQPRQTRPLPGGRQLNGNSVPVQSRLAFDENSEWSHIIRDSLNEAGLV